jgi:hypothetical protein
MERSSGEASQARPDRGHASSGGDRAREAGPSAGRDKEIERGASGDSGNTDACIEGFSVASISAPARQPRAASGRFEKTDRARRYNENLARQADARRQADAFKAQVLEELGGRIEASKEPLLDALCATRVRADTFKRKGRVNKFLEESERYVRLAYMLGLIKAGQHAEKPAPKEMPARDHAEWVAMRRRRKK